MAIDELVFRGSDKTESQVEAINGSRRATTDQDGHASYDRPVRAKTVGRRIAPILPHLSKSASLSEDSASELVEQQLKQEMGNDIQYRTCSWRKTAALLFSEYICLAIMSFPYSYSVLGLVPGIILTVVVAALVLYTSLIVWEFCLRHPEVRDVCDIGQMLFWGKTWAWYATAVMFLLNNTFIQALHVLVSAKYLNTITNHSQCTVIFSVIAAIICWFFSLPRTFGTLAKLATLSAFFTFVSVLLASVFAGIQEHPRGYTPNTATIDPLTGSHGGEPLVTATPVPGTTYIAGMSAFLNISYTFIGQITLPSFIAEMHEPRDFPKALWAVTIAEIIVFCCVGGVIYGYTGNQYMTAPAFGSLGNTLQQKVSFSFMIPTLIFLGVLYASVSARFIFFRLFDGTRHKTSHTLLGWTTWAAILAATWAGALVIAEVIPFFTDLLSLMSSLFDSFFGFIFWGVAYIRMRRVDEDGAHGHQYRGPLAHRVRRAAMFALNIGIILIGCYFLTAGTYTSVQSIADNYKAGNVGHVFSCADNGI